MPEEIRCKVVEGLEVVLKGVLDNVYTFKVDGTLTNNQMAVFRRFETWVEKDQSFELPAKLGAGQDEAWFVAEVAGTLKEWLEAVNSIILDKPQITVLADLPLAGIDFVTIVRTEGGAVFPTLFPGEVVFWPMAD